ncbi:hypothetical protein, partial [Mycobacterium kiyosense]|uniref:hypothetical protein n=1 Tax=Mycobacterium kiyosense TaxID=2871094 RepID=UPI002231BA5B
TCVAVARGAGGLGWGLPVGGVGVAAVGVSAELGEDCPGSGLAVVLVEHPANAPVSPTPPTNPNSCRRLTGNACSADRSGGAFTASP